MMKIGLLTFHDTNNFGSYLQTYGLYKKVIELGCDCEIIDYKCQAIHERENYGKYHLDLNPKHIIAQLLFNGSIRTKYKNLMRWLKENSSLSNSYSISNIKMAANKYDKFIVGSDIVWGLDITQKDTTFFLDFLDDSKKKYAFSSSIGNPWSAEDKKLLAPMLRSFRGIAVREVEAVEWVRELTDNSPTLVCDPTMLLTSSDWAKFASSKYKSRKYVLLYFPTKEGIRDAQLIAKRYDAECLVINYGTPLKGLTTVKPTNLADFLSLFLNASFVCTGSYHGMLFSIYFNREFAYYNRAHKSRMNSLASILGVQNREGTRYSVTTMDNIDYKKVNTAVNNFRIQSIDCLEKMLKQ